MQRIGLVLTLLCCLLFAASANAAVLIGDTAVAGSQDNNSAGQAEAFRYTAPASGAISDAQVYVDMGSSATTLLVGVYSNNSYGKPGTLLASGKLASPKSAAWNDVPLSAASMTSGSPYWIALLGTGGQLNFRDTDGGSTTYTSSQTNLTSLPASYSSGTGWASGPASVYVNTGGAPPPPPSATPPSNTGPATISGTAEQGQALTASPGSWSGTTPMTYTYAWSDGANGQTDTLSSADVGKMVSVTVTATNSAGSAQSTSAAMGPVASAPLPPPPPTAGPTAAFSFSPSSPVTGQSVHFDGSASTCPAGGCTYYYHDVGSRGIEDWPLIGPGTSRSGDFAFSETGTKYVQLKVTDSLGQVATVQHNVVVSATPPPPPTPPSNTGTPMITGTPQQGQTLTANPGSWSGTTPITYSYAWSDGTTGQTDPLGASDVGQKITVTVTARNSAGSASATSASVGPVTTAPQPPPPGSQTLHCFKAPGACGYPDPSYGNVGVPAGTALTNSGPITVTTPGAVVSGLNISGSAPGIDIQAPNVTVQNTRVTVTGGGCGFQSTCGNADIRVESGATGAKISHVELATDSSTTVEHAIRNFPDGTQVDHAYINGPDALAWAAGNMNVSDSYSRISLRISNDHLENVYCPGGESITLNHNTFENQAGQVAASIFCDTNGGSGGTCSSHLTVTNNFMVGGGYDLYECGNASSQGSASLTFTGNDVARCTTGPIVQTNDGGYNCNGAPFEPNSDDATLGSADQNGFFPYGGHYGVASYTYCTGNGSSWSGNYYDDNGSTVSC